MVGTEEKLGHQGHPEAAVGFGQLENMEEVRVCEPRQSRGRKGQAVGTA